MIISTVSRRIGCHLIGLFMGVISLVSLYSQEPEDSLWYLDKPIADIVFEGLTNIQVGELEGIIQPFRGQTFNDTLFQDLQRRIYALDYFSEIIANAERGDDSELIIQFDVIEYPIVEMVRFSGNVNVSSADLLEAVVLKIGDILTDQKIRSDEGALRNVYRMQGFSEISVEGIVLETLNTGSRIVEFRIQEGIQILIQEVKFFGNGFASDGVLRRSHGKQSAVYIRQRHLSRIDVGGRSTSYTTLLCRKWIYRRHGTGNNPRKRTRR